MALFQSLESRYAEAVELNQALRGFLRGGWDEEYACSTTRSITPKQYKRKPATTDWAIKEQQKLQKQLQQVHSAYKSYWRQKKNTVFFREWWSYTPWSLSYLKTARKHLKMQLSRLHEAHTTFYQCIENQTGIGTWMLSSRSTGPITANEKQHIDYCISRYRNGDPDYKQYGPYYKRQIALMEIEHRFFTGKLFYLYMGFFFVAGLLGVGLALAALFWPPAMVLLIGGKVGIMAMKIASVLLYLPILYGGSALFQWVRNKLYGEDTTRADWHGNHVLAFDVVVLVAALMVTLLPLLYIVTLPHGDLIAIILLGSFSAVSAMQATIALLDPKRRIDYLGSGLTSPVGQGKEAVNLKRSLSAIFSFSSEHRRHPVKFLLNPAEWVAAMMGTVQSLCLRLCEIGATQGTRSGLWRFKLKQHMVLVMDFFMAPVRLAALVIDAPLRFMDFTHEKAILVDGVGEEKSVDEAEGLEEEAMESEWRSDYGKCTHAEPLLEEATDVCPPKWEKQPISRFRWLFDSSRPHATVDFSASDEPAVMDRASATL